MIIYKYNTFTDQNINISEYIFYNKNIKIDPNFQYTIKYEYRMKEIFIFFYQCPKN